QTEEKAASDAVSLCPTTGFEDQALVETGALVLWGTGPAHVAGHDNMGWSWLDDIPTGTTTEITCGPATGTYKAVDHSGVSYQGGSAPGWFNNYDLVLQTCKGSGTGFTMAQRI